MNKIILVICAGLVVLLIIALLVSLLFKKPQEEVKTTIPKQTKTDQTTFNKNSLPRIKSITPDSLPSSKPNMVLPEDSKISYSGEMINNPQALDYYSLVKKGLTEQIAQQIAVRLGFNSAPEVYNNYLDHTVLEWKNQTHNLKIEVENNSITLDKLLSATKKSPINEDSAYQQTSDLVSKIEGKTIILNTDNTIRVANPANPQIISLELPQYPTKYPVVNVSNKWNSFVHINLESGLIESLQYYLKNNFTKQGSKKLIDFKIAVQPENIQNGSINSLNTPGGESDASPTGKYTLVNANLTSAKLAYYINNEISDNVLIPVYVFTGKAQVSEFPNQTFEIEYLIRAFKDE